jgi:hypothetical protein
MIRDFSVVILEDCVAAFDEELHLASPPARAPWPASGFLTLPFRGLLYAPPDSSLLFRF